MEELLEALVELAYVPENKCRLVNQKKRIYTIPNWCLITKIKNLDVLLPTHTLPVKKNRDYSNIVGKWVVFLYSFWFLKKIYCRNSFLP